MPVSLQTAGGQLSIASINIGVNASGAYRCRNLYVLWQEAAQRGKDRVLPAVDGVKAYRRRRDVTVHTLELVIVGDITYTGSTPSSTLVGLETNYWYLRDNVVAPTTGDGTRAATLTLPSGTTKTANVHVLELKPGQTSNNYMLATMDISIPAGRFA